MDVASAAELMASLDVAVLPVASEDQVVVLMTDRDLVIRSIAAGVDPKKVTVGQIATTSGLVTIDADADVSRAEELMAQNRVRRLLVIDEGGFLGVASLGDLAVHDPSNGIRRKDARRDLPLGLHDEQSRRLALRSPETRACRCEDPRRVS